MSVLEISLWAAAAIPLLYRIWAGWKTGATTEMRHLLANLFALLVALYFWRAATEGLSNVFKLEPRWLAILAFAGLYAVAFLVAAFAVRLKGQVYQSVEPNPLNALLGVLAGAFTGSLIAGSLLLLLTLATPSSPEASSPLGMLRSWPEAVFQTIEENLAGIPPSAPERARLPRVELVDVPIEGATTEDGGSLVRRQPSITGWE